MLLLNNLHFLNPPPSSPTKRFLQVQKHLFSTLLLSKNEYIKALVQRGSTSYILFSPSLYYNETMKIATFAVAVLAVACTVTLAAPVAEKRDIPDINVVKADVGNNGSIVKIKDTKPNIGKEGKGLVHVEADGVEVLDDTVVARPS
ncbi:hypothetical protein BGZ70_005445 [Mortierella alpina]|uniref:Uncharacterized protein n=1 Tax=Mortierella alpina TaxID=64518 RepID=A0A9P6M6C7_MORAP|nr:hypothetical protein BGZ70_005445 [Mortierella alpina]